MNHAELSAGALLPSPNRPQGGHVGFGRHDGIGNIQINSALTEDAAVKLEAFLRELIAEDAPKLAAQQQRAQAEMVAERQSYERKRYADALNMANRNNGLGNLSGGVFDG